ncbi:MAG TPA: L,D-transpeptidase [Candidatus Eisenbacteria bacterium]|nr:L,D-transpeptidase [Candidatus Eisenbacteria bacterium]
MRTAIASLVLVPFGLAGFGAANVVTFDARAAALEQSWSAAQAAGVPAQLLTPARADLQALRDRHVVFLPFSIFSGALLFDPFGGPEDRAARSEAEVLPAARQRAEEDLARLKEAGGPNYPSYRQRAAALASARTLVDYVKLARAWEAEAARLDAVRDALSKAAGGLSDGLPKDVVDGVNRLQAVMSAAAQSQLSADPGAQALAHAQEYLKQPYPGLLEQHDAVAGEVQSAADTVQRRVDLRVQDDQLVGRLPDLLSQAARLDVAAGTRSQATKARDDLLSARASGDDSRIEAATGALKQAVDQLSAAVTAAQKAANAAALASGTGCVTGEPVQLIVIHLATQKLVAYDHGCPFLTSLVTTGRAGLRTDQGTFTIHAKYASYLMHSPWQPSTNPLWYPDTVVHDAMLIVPADGTFIHSAEWEPESAYGPGSEDGPYHSHGCVHVPNGPLATLYGWANVGATVIVMS